MISLLMLREIVLGVYNVNLFRLNSGYLLLDYVTSMDGFGYTPLILRSTRVTTTSAALVDNIWLNDDSMVS